MIKLPNLPKKRLLIPVVVLVLAGLGGVSYALKNDKPTPAPAKHVALEQAPVPTEEPAAAPTPTPVVAAQTAPVPTPAPAPTQTSVDWWKSLKSSYSDDEVGCVLSIVLKRGKTGDAAPAVLQAELDYAVSKYSTPCLALAKLANVPSAY